ncbi:DUF4142 domain-containing protein [Massilia horti]|uniref:DUF4142 domain-containing protein n=2 Tax=Massilia horti TaxID=2562153 RepID=A0A4Y9SVT4_9BURK|nr:DUF4142 domain-containing protein [Massilia horti]
MSVFGAQAQTATSTAPDAASQSGNAGQQAGSSAPGSASQGGSMGQQGSSPAPDQSGQGASMGQPGSSPAQDPASQGASMGQQGSSGTSGSTGTTSSEQMSGSSQGASATAAGATSAGAAKLSKSDEKILKGMAQANIDEIEAGKLAQTKSQNDEVKKFAQQMIDDHTKALNEAQQVAQEKGVTLPTGPDAKHKKAVASLEKLSGEAFDKAYMKNAGLNDHRMVLAQLQRDEKNAKDADVKGLATKMTPVVEQHLKAAEQISASKGGATAGK